MDENKQRQEVSLIGRILSLEFLLLLMGSSSLVYGIIKAEIINISIGLVLVVVILSLMIRRKPAAGNIKSNK